MGFIASLLLIILLENIVAQNGVMFELICNKSYRRKWADDLLTGLYMFCAALFAWGASQLVGIILGFDFLLIPVLALGAYFLPKLIKKAFMHFFIQFSQWNAGVSFSYVGALFVMAMVAHYRVDIFGALVIGFGMAFGYLLLLFIYKSVMERLYYTTLAEHFDETSLSFIILGVIGLLLSLLGLSLAGLSSNLL